jgi:GDP-4-dehydro-6-deoxy-D-mannose reductase
VRHLRECGDEVLVTYGGAGAHYSGAEQLDVRDGAKTSEIVRRFLPEVVYHLAGVAFVPQAEENFQETLLANVLGTSNLCRQCHLLDRPVKFIFVSSAEVYGAVDPSQVPISETLSPQPQNNYSLSKFMAEQVVLRYQRQGRLKAVIARPFNHIGPGQDSRFVAASFADQLARIAVGRAEPVIKVGNLEARRDFSDVRDIVIAYRLMAERGEGVYNLGSGTPLAVRALLDQLVTASGLTVRVEVEESRYRKTEVLELYADISKAVRELGWQPKIAIQETLKEIYLAALKRVTVQ